MFSQQNSPGGSIHSQLIKTSFIDLLLEPVLCQPKLAHKLLAPHLVEQEELSSPGLANLSRHNEQPSSRCLVAEFTSFDVVSAPEGFREFKSVVTKVAGYRAGDPPCDFELLEHQTVSLLRHIIIEPDEGLACTLYELFDSDCKGRMDITHFFVLFVLVSAIESKKLLEFQHKYGKVIFDMLAAKWSSIPYEKMLTYTGLVLDKSVVEIQRMLQRVDIDKDQPLTFSDYEVFMFDSINTEYKTKEIDPRLFVYEYVVEEKKGRYAEIFKKTGK